MMERPAAWKVITVGAALTGLGIVGAGAASAAAPAPTWVPDIGVVSPGTVVALDDDWTETYWDDRWIGQRGGDDWTDTYWDD